MAAESNESPKNRKVFLFIIIIIILVAINGVQFYFTQVDQQKNQELLENREMELITTFAKLDSISDELEDKITEIRRLDGNVDSLLEIQTELQQEKIDLQNSQRITQDRYNQIKSKVEGYEILLKKKDEEIATLKEVNVALLEETYALKEQKQQLTGEINKLQEATSVLEKKVNTAATLKVEAFELVAINRQYKELIGDSFKVRQLVKLLVKYQLEINDLAEIGTKEIFLRIVEPDGSALYNLTAGSGSFDFNTGKLFYTKSQEILFDNSGQSFQFEFDKGTDFKKGQYIVELYSEGSLIGSTTFIVR